MITAVIFLSQFRRSVLRKRHVTYSVSDDVNPDDDVSTAAAAADDDELTAKVAASHSALRRLPCTARTNLAVLQLQFLAVSRAS